MDSSIEQDPIALEDVISAYLGCSNILPMLEHSEMIEIWEWIRRGGFSVPEAINALKIGVGRAAHLKTEPLIVQGFEYRSEMDHPDFEKYVRAKLGMM